MSLESEGQSLHVGNASFGQEKQPEASVEVAVVTQARPTSGNFEALGLSAQILRAVLAEGYTIPTPIQSAAIPAVLAGNDLLGCAQTGTGKTAALRCRSCIACRPKSRPISRASAAPAAFAR